MSDFAYGDVSGSLREDELTLGYLEQSGVTERLKRKGVTEVAINRPFEIWIETSADGWLREEAPWLTLDMCEYLASTLAVYNHRELSPQSPIKTVELPEGERGQLVIPPACERGTVSMTFRKPSLQRFTLDDYVSSGRFGKANRTVNRQKELFDWQKEMKRLIAAREFIEFFRLAVQHKLNIIIFGGTGSGKTTFAKAVVDVYPRNKRLLTIEELNEMKLPYHLNHVHLLYGDYVTPKDLVSCCMRMKGDHILLAELTGDEAWDFMELLNTGHPGTITTAHANGSLHGYARIAGLIKQSAVGAGLDFSYIDRRVRTSFDVVMYMEHTEILDVTYEPEVQLALLNGASIESALSCVR
ncbi:P-type DNA transfer ATPase VirB11 [Salmonella enterica subsp. enterica]|uniref:Type IV secretion system protein n=2 Tax=Salmonella enterica TaxID=28901 RepID=A0A734FV34_SALET|nr:P-type DNA transfer ATPase VirB11 [Salmonella enterica]EAA5587887.1 P-type DNA transfer ATPase VirB11 [Salmonella enterica subsp. enterica serovar Muenchen]EBG2392078.1 P-type DNA transfer ATPase VirB11 [Salmonella enterica subsp. enterica serovar Cotham]EBV0857982.1 P-type DNA transfer ATPase VirB11 [Salmonella enterica subsp. enterica serovar Anecho]EBV2360271.1 P-type DNA transfer ATPase VirB11 [Salmonella enterica subsp. enterica serovar Ago]EBV2691461.1 P-type DNA transfer ATPase VirB1